MQNEILWLAMLLANFFLIILAYKLFGKWGLIMWIPISVIVANIQVIQTIQLFGFVATLGNIVYASSFLVTDILSENYGKKEAKKASVKVEGWKSKRTALGKGDFNLRLAREITQWNIEIIDITEEKNVDSTIV